MRKAFYLLDRPSWRRIEALLALYVILILILIARYYSLQVIHRDRFTKQSTALIERKVPLPPPRGEILDRKGRKLVINEIQLSCVLERYVYDKLPEALKKKVLKAISDITGEPLSTLEAKVKSSTYDVVLASKLSLREASLIMESGLSRYGVSVQPTYVRRYTHPSLAHVIGYVGLPSDRELREGILPTEYVGKTGLERSYNELLRGKPGYKVYLQDVAGHPISLKGVKAPEKGKDLVTTIDLHLQEVAYRLMDEKWDELVRLGRRRWGGAIVMMKTDGSVLVSVSYPTYDPNKFVNGISQKEYQELLKPPYPLLNRVTSGLYPPASTFKIVTALAALEEGVITPSTIINCTGVYYLGSYGFACFNRAGHGPLNLRQALTYSCDYYFYKVGRELGWKRLVKWADKLGVGEPTGIEIYEEAGLLPTPSWKERVYREEWVPGDTINMSIGQGMLLVTPLQVAVYTAAIATGMKPEPRLAIVKPVKLTPIGASESHLRAIREGMRGAVRSGTATVVERLIRRSGLNVKVAGKTGTCENYPSAYNPQGLNHTWFTAFAPYEDPEVVVTVFLEQSGGYGGQHAAEIAAKLLIEYFRERGMKRITGNS